MCQCNLFALSSVICFFLRYFAIVCYLVYLFYFCKWSSLCKWGGATCYNRSWLLPQCQNYNFCQKFVFTTFVNILFSRILSTFNFHNFCQLFIFTTFVIILFPQRLSTFFLSPLLSTFYSHNWCQHFICQHDKLCN